VLRGSTFNTTSLPRCADHYPPAGHWLLAAVFHFGYAGRRGRELVLHWTPAVTFSFLIPYGYEWLRRRASTR
jgi:hypothetical protein